MAALIFFGAEQSLPILHLSEERNSIVPDKSASSEGYVILWPQMDVRIAEMRARNRRTAQPGDDAHMSGDDMQTTRDLLPFGPADVNMTVQSAYLWGTLLSTCNASL